MKFVKKFRNDDHFRSWFANYRCDVPGCVDPTDKEPTEKTVSIDPKNFKEETLIRCPRCGEFSGATKKQQLLDNKAAFLEKIHEIDVQLQILEMTETEQHVLSGSGKESK